MTLLQHRVQLRINSLQTMRTVQSFPVLDSFHWTCISYRAINLTSLYTKRHSSTARKAKIPQSAARTRFAPSPTGNLHLGSIRTALFNYLIAKRTKGQFLLRIEDTDRKRTIPGAEERLLEDLRWAGLQWDEGPAIGGPYGPYKQSERGELYQEHAQILLANGTAYRCFCSAERIDRLNRLRHEKGLPLGYDRKCADLPVHQVEERVHKGESHVLRFRVPKEYPKFNDLVYGKTGHGAEKARKLQVDEPVFDDPILLKSDGYPTYHFANVVDDQLMKITHVIRGSEWMASTPLHVALYGAFGWTPPAFGHVPLLVDQNRQKLSKRNLDMDIASYRNAEYFPEAITNFAALLGWSHQQKNDVMDLSELERIFDLKFTRGNTIVAFNKLDYLQEQHARRRITASGEQFEQMIRGIALMLLDRYGAAHISHFIGQRSLRDVIASMLQTESLPYRSAAEFVRSTSIFLRKKIDRPPLEPNEESLLKSLRTAAATLCLVPSQSWNRDVHRANLAMLQLAPENAGLSTQNFYKKNLFHYLRWALLGGMTGPSIPETMEILGREICVSRVQEAALAIKEMENQATKPEISSQRSKIPLDV